MRVLAVSLSVPGTVTIRGKAQRTGIFKVPTTEPVRITVEGLAGDVQVNRKVHGAPDKAVYLYPNEHGAAWAREFGIAFGPGVLGENLLIEGLLEAEVATGDRLRVGGAILRVTEPRMPCATLVAKFNEPRVAKYMLAEVLTGFYATVEQEGDVVAGDAIEMLSRAEGGITIAEQVQGGRKTHALR
ncbi:MOSC domain-containing protein [Viridibacterium curvum]|uniref:MOSC domain-containing protein n=1 Tax=Viridibacterium curvum TaxID=1101404 RepID=A0ABP9QSH9_9RHOO